MKFIFDSYEWRARIAPAVIVSLPVFITLTSCFSWPTPQIGKVLSGSMWFAVLLVLTIIIRNAGNKIEPKLWESWGGPPSTIVIRWNDDYISKDIKIQIHKAVNYYLDLPMPSENEERNNKQYADKMIDQVFMRVRSIIREKDPKGIWSVENAYYGLQRNLFGSRKIWIIFSILGIIINGFFYWLKKKDILIAGLIGNVIILILSIHVGWIVLPKSVKHSAFRYAENSWNSFLNIAFGMQNIKDDIKKEKSPRQKY